MGKKNKTMKGQYLYIKNKKRKEGIKSFVAFMIAGSIFLLGLVLNDWDRANIVTIIAALLVMPAAKLLVGFLILLPYQSVAIELYDKVMAVKKEEDVLYTDVVFTSKDKVMNLNFLAVVGDELIGFVGRKKEDAIYMKSYLTKELKTRALPYKVAILEEEKQYISRLKKGNREYKNEQESIRLQEFLVSLMV